MKKKDWGKKGEIITNLDGYVGGPMGGNSFLKKSIPGQQKNLLIKMVRNLFNPNENIFLEYEQQ